MRTRTNVVAGQGWKRTGNTGHLRSFTVNNGHSKRWAGQVRNALTRLGEHARGRVRFPPAPRKVPSTRGNTPNGRRDRSPVQHPGSPGQMPPDCGNDQVLHLLDVVVEAQVLGAEDGKRTDDAVVKTMVPARVMMSFPSPTSTRPTSHGMWVILGPVLCWAAGLLAQAQKLTRSRSQVASRISSTPRAATASIASTASSAAGDSTLFDTRAQRPCRTRLGRSRCHRSRPAVRAVRSRRARRDLP